MGSNCQQEHFEIFFFFYLPLFIPIVPQNASQSTYFLCFFGPESMYALN